MSEGLTPENFPQPDIDLRETVGEPVGIQALENLYSQSPDGLGLNTTMALAASLRGSGTVLRTNQDTQILGTTTAEVIAQGYQRLIHPEATNFPEVYSGLFEKLVPASSSAGSLALFLASNLQDRTTYAESFSKLSNQERYDGRSSLLSADAQLCIALEKIVEDYLHDYIELHVKAPKDLFHPEVLALFCDKTLRSAPVVRTVRGLATSSLITHKRATGLSAPARAWLRTHSGQRPTANAPQ